MSYYCPTLLPEDLKRSETEQSSLWYNPPTPFAPPSIDNGNRKEHEVKVNISKKVSATASVFHGGIPEILVMYLSDCAVLVHKKERVEKLTGWKNKEASASENIMPHDVDKSKPNKKETEKDAPEDSAASNKEVDKTTKKKSKKKNERGEDTSAHSNSELDAWTIKKLAFTEKKGNASKHMQSTMKEVFSLYELLLS